MTLSIRWKVALGTLLGVALGLAAAGWIFLRAVEWMELARLGDALEARTNLALYLLQPSLAVPDRLSAHQAAALQTAVQALSQRAQARLTILSADGRVLADSATAAEALPRLENHATRPEIVQAQATGRGTDIRLSQTTGERLFYLALPIAVRGAPPRGFVRLAVPLTQLEERLQALEYRMLLAFAVAFAVAVTVSVLLARSLTRPLSEMTAMARGFAQGALGQRLRTTSGDEIGALTATLNQMADQLEAKIREVSDERAQLLAMLTAMVEGVMVLDCRGRILLVNPALEWMFSLRSAAARGRTHWEVVRHHELNELVTRVLDTRQHFGAEITLAPSGRILHVEASVAGGQRENEACAVLVFHDVTALRRLEKVRKDFVANVSHELRTPLTSIKGYVEALMDGVKDQPEEATRFLQVIMTQADRLTLILNDLLQLAQIESGQVELKREPVRLQSVIERTLASLMPLVEKKRDELVVDLPADLPAVRGDEERLVQVLTNLVDNAVKYTPEHGRITISARRVAVPTSDGRHEDVVELSVTDTGVGIPEPDRPRVFERFYRVDKARSRELGGTGLGLAIVKHLVEGHGGQVWVEGNVPVGSRFVIRLPVAGTETVLT